MIFLLIAAFIVIADQALKFYATANLAGAGEVRLIPYILHLSYSRNDGASLGFLSGQRLLLVAASVTAAAAIIFMLFSQKVKCSRTEKYALSVVLGGAAGNLVDRLHTGEVVDMLFFPWIGKIPLLPDFICNLADIAVVFGGIAFVILYARRELKHKEANDADDG